MGGLPQEGPIIRRLAPQTHGYAFSEFMGEDEKVQTDAATWLVKEIKKAVEERHPEHSGSHVVVIIIHDVRKTLPNKYDSEHTVRIATTSGPGGYVRLMENDEHGQRHRRLERLTLRLEMSKKEIMEQQGI